jgi:hypothetical protein
MNGNLCLTDQHCSLGLATKDSASHAGMVENGQNEKSMRKTAQSAEKTRILHKKRARHLSMSRSGSA